LPCEHHPDRNRTIRMRRSASRKSPRLTRFSPTLRSALSTTASATLASGNAAGAGAGFDPTVPGLRGNLWRVLRLRRWHSAAVAVAAAAYTRADLRETSPSSSRKRSSARRLASWSAATKPAKTAAIGNRSRQRSCDVQVFAPAAARCAISRLLQHCANCPSCPGSGNVITDPCAKCRGEGRVLAAALGRCENPRRRSKTANPHSIHRRRRRLARSVARPAISCCAACKRAPVLCAEGKRSALRRPAFGNAKAAMGAEIKVPTLEGEHASKTPDGTQPSATFRIRNKGVPV